MSVRIRMTRMGTKKRPFYRLVAADSEAPRDGRFLDILGYYDPMKDPVEVKIHEDKINYWVEQGARVSEAVQAILKKEGKMQSHSAPN